MLKFFIFIFLVSLISLYWKESMLPALSVSNYIIYCVPLNSYMFLMTGVFEGSGFRLLLCLMSVLIFLYFFISMKSYYFSGEANLFYLLSVSLLTVCALFFFTFNLLTMYITFEVSIIPIFFIVLGWGYQMERVEAGMSLFFYTLVASMPLLYSLLTMSHSWNMTDMLEISMLGNSQSVNLFMFLAITAFLVKLPMYGVHMWLPKAHVEAPVGGSMVLAAVLLKLGGLGLLMLLPLVYNYSGFMLLSAVGLIGSMVVSLSCLRVADLKMLIAYSSVAHMSYLVFSLSLGYQQMLMGGLLMMIMHGFTSSGMFLLCYYLYVVSKSRSLFLNKGLLTLSVVMSAMWFMTLISNMAAPPTLNFISELFIIISLVNFDYISLIFMFVGILASSGYILLMYSSVTQGQPFMGFYEFSKISYALGVVHVIWMFAPLILVSLLKLSI